MRNFDSVPQNLSAMLKQVNGNEAFKKFIKKTAQKMNFQKKNILNLTQEKIETLYQTLKAKQQNTQYDDEVAKTLQNSIWLQNQLKIFIYIMCTHLFFKRISIHELRQEDFIFLHDFFPNKRPQHLEYQVKLLLSNKNSKWSLEESKLFRVIMKTNQQSKRWNYIAKELFIHSKKKFFKTPKQCRQRWINHEDPSKIKGNWETSQDCILLQSVIELGKKWTLITCQLNETRTENSVKNRYNSLIKTAKKTYGYEKTQYILIDLMLRQRKLLIKKQQISIDPQIKVEAPLPQIQNFTELKISQKKQKFTAHEIEEEFSLQKDLKMELQIKPEKNLSMQCLDLLNNDFKHVFEQSQQIENIVWNASESPLKLEQNVEKNFSFVNGHFSFDLDDNI